MTVQGIILLLLTVTVGVVASSSQYALKVHRLNPTSVEWDFLDLTGTCPEIHAL